ncbi:MAG: folP [Chloroflexi bacterium]|nr:folP [Chloroflexota bacterium]
MNELRPPGGDRAIPTQVGVVPARPGAGGAAASSSFALPPGSGSGLPTAPASLEIRSQRFDWGSRTFLMGIVNVTPDSFSGDGLLAKAAAGAKAGAVEQAGAVDRAPDPVALAVALGQAMVADGADILDVGGESSRPGHAAVPAEEEISRVLPVVRALRAVLPGVPLSVDTVKPAVAASALEAGADIVNDVWAVAPDDSLARIAAEHGAPLVLMHNRAEARYRSLLVEVLADLERAIDRALAAGVAWERLLVDPGFGFGKTPAHNLALLRELPAIRLLGRPVVLGTSRKSTLGKVLDLPPDERLEATLATTALAVAAGVDVVRVHDVRPNVRAARMADAVVRGWTPPDEAARSAPAGLAAATAMANGAPGEASR